MDEYKKADVIELGDAAYSFFKAVRDGIGVDDSDELVALVTAAGKCGEEFKDRDAFFPHLIGRLADRAGDDGVG